MIEKAYSLVRNGPPNEAGIVMSMVGLWVWWRMWALYAIWVIPLIAGIYTFQYTDDVVFGILATWFVSLIVHPTAMKLSPKYDITENY